MPRGASGAAARWKKRLKQLSVKPALKQLDRETVEWGSEANVREAFELANGCVLDAEDLKRICQAAGFQRGPIQDGGYFYDYRRLFLEIAIAAVIELEGVHAAGVNEGMLLGVSFYELEQTEAGAWEVSAAKVPMKNVPPTVLTDCLHTLWALMKSSRNVGPAQS